MFQVNDARLKYLESLITTLCHLERLYLNGAALRKISYHFITEWLSFHKRVANFKSSKF